MTTTPTESAQKLRRRAEDKSRLDDATPFQTPSPEEAQQLLHDLRVHQIELEMQNDELQRTQAELESARARYFDLYELAPVGYLTVSENGLIREANLAAATMLGVTRKILLQNVMSKFIFTEDQDVHFLNRKLLIETHSTSSGQAGDSRNWEMRMQRADGSTFWAHLQAIPSSDGGYRATFTDISERKRAEEVLIFLAQTSVGSIAHEPFFNALARYLATSLDMDFVCIDRLEGDGLAARTVAVWCDGHFEDNVTYTLKDTPCGDVVGKEVCCFPASVCQFFPRDQVLLDLRAESYVGVTLWSHAGKPIGLIAVIGRKPLLNRKLTEATLKMVAVRASGELERLDAEAELREIDRFKLSILNSISDAFFSLDNNLVVTYFNNMAERVLGRRREEVIGNKLFDVFPEARGSIFEENYTKALKGKIELSFETYFPVSPYQNWYVVRVYPHEEGISVYFQTITERKLAEKALLEKNAELERFTYTVSHDLKSPLITIQSYAGMIVKDLEAGKYERAGTDIKRIEGAADKMTALLNDLLELSRVGRMMNEPSRIDMNRLVGDVLMQLAGSLKNNQVEVVVQPDLPTALGDQKRIAEVLQNLIENAIKYMGDRAVSRVEIGTRQDGNRPVYFVKDNGVGIDTLHHERIFGLFNKLDSTSEGTGVGLALVKRIIEIHGGKVWVESEGEGMGSCFCFTLPGKGE